MKGDGDGVTPIITKPGPLLKYFVRDEGDKCNGVAMLTVAVGGEVASGEVLRIPKDGALLIAKAIVDYFSNKSVQMNVPDIPKK